MASFSLPNRPSGDAGNLEITLTREAILLAALTAYVDRCDTMLAGNPTTTGIDPIAEHVAGSRAQALLLADFIRHGDDMTITRQRCRHLRRDTHAR